MHVHMVCLTLHNEHLIITFTLADYIKVLSTSKCGKLLGQTKVVWVPKGHPAKLIILISV